MAEARKEQGVRRLRFLLETSEDLQRLPLQRNLAKTPLRLAVFDPEYVLLQIDVVGSQPANLTRTKARPQHNKKNVMPGVPVAEALFDPGPIEEPLDLVAREPARPRSEERRGGQAVRARRPR